jgi:hypothetical protein
MLGQTQLGGSVLYAITSCFCTFHICQPAMVGDHTLGSRVMRFTQTLPRMWTKPFFSNRINFSLERRPQRVVEHVKPKGPFLVTRGTGRPGNHEKIAFQRNVANLQCENCSGLCEIAHFFLAKVLCEECVLAFLRTKIPFSPGCILCSDQKREIVLRQIAKRDRIPLSKWCIHRQEQR